MSKIFLNFMTLKHPQNSEYIQDCKSTVICVHGQFSYVQLLYEDKVFTGALKTMKFKKILVLESIRLCGMCSYLVRVYTGIATTHLSLLTCKGSLYACIYIHVHNWPLALSVVLSHLQQGCHNINFFMSQLYVIEKHICHNIAIATMFSFVALIHANNNQLLT